MRIMDRDWTTIDDFSPPVGCRCVFWWERNWRWATVGNRPEAATLSWWCAEHGWVGVDDDGCWACPVRLRPAVVTLPVERIRETGQLPLFGAAA